VRILDYQKPNPTAYGQKRKKSFFDRFGGSMVGSALMPQGMSREDMPLQAPPRIPDIQMPQGGLPKLAGMFLRYQGQDSPSGRRTVPRGAMGRDGGMSPWDAEDQGSMPLPNYNPRKVTNVGPNGWYRGNEGGGTSRSNGLGLSDDADTSPDYRDTSRRPRARLARVMGPGNAAPTHRKKRQRVSDSWLG
jgi:hypothetical protein